MKIKLLHADNAGKQNILEYVEIYMETFRYAFWYQYY